MEPKSKHNCLTFICDGRKNGWGYFQCDCNSIRCVVLKKKNEVRKGKVKSCGCYYKRFGTHNKRHGETNKTVENKIWKKIMEVNKKDAIFVCDRWKDYESFVEDVGRRPSKLHRFVRLDKTKGFYPENCSWIDYSKPNKEKPTKGRSGHYSEWKNQYNCWYQMIQRCFNEDKDNFYLYGGAGITVCDRWLGEDGFKNFCEDMGHRPDKNYTLHRIDNSLGYSPENCMWLSTRGQAIHRRSSRFIKYKDYNFNMSTWAEILDINYGTFKKYIYLGISIEEILAKPINGKFPRDPEDYLKQHNERISELYPDMA